MQAAYAGDTMATGVVEEYDENCGEKDGQTPCKALDNVLVIESKVNRKDTTNKLQGGLYALKIPTGSPSYTLAFCKPGYQRQWVTDKNDGHIRKLDPVRLYRNDRSAGLPTEKLKEIVQEQSRQVSILLETNLPSNWLELPRTNLKEIRKAIVKAVARDHPNYRITNAIDDSLSELEWKLGKTKHDVCDQ